MMQMQCDGRKCVESEKCTAIALPSSLIGMGNEENGVICYDFDNAGYKKKLILNWLWQIGQWIFELWSLVWSAYADEERKYSGWSQYNTMSCCIYEKDFLRIKYKSLWNENKTTSNVLPFSHPRGS